MIGAAAPPGAPPGALSPIQPRCVYLLCVSVCGLRIRKIIIFLHIIMFIYCDFFFFYIICLIIYYDSIVSCYFRY